jgi:hypothetical protein
LLLKFHKFQKHSVIVTWECQTHRPEIKKEMIFLSWQIAYSKITFTMHMTFFSCHCDMAQCKQRTRRRVTCGLCWDHEMWWIPISVLVCHLAASPEHHWWPHCVKWLCELLLGYSSGPHGHGLQCCTLSEEGQEACLCAQWWDRQHVSFNCIEELIQRQIIQSECFPCVFKLFLLKSYYVILFLKTVLRNASFTEIYIKIWKNWISWWLPGHIGL